MAIEDVMHANRFNRPACQIIMTGLHCHGDIKQEMLRDQMMDWSRRGKPMPEKIWLAVVALATALEELDDGED